MYIWKFFWEIFDSDPFLVTKFVLGTSEPLGEEEIIL